MKYRTFIAAIVAAGTIGAGVAYVTTGQTRAADAAETDEGIAADELIADAALKDGVLIGSFVPITPCRLMDTRPGTRINAATTFGPAQTQSVNALDGNCTFPIDAYAIVANITGVGQTAQTFITAFPDGADRPLAATLNPTPGLPAYNSTTIFLPASRLFNLYNNAGNVDIIVDVVGYHAGFVSPYVPAIDDAFTTEIVDVSADGGTTSGSVQLTNASEQRWTVVQVVTECPDEEQFTTTFHLVDPGDVLVGPAGSCDGNLDAADFTIVDVDAQP